MNTPAPITTVAEYSDTAAALADLKTRFGGIVVDVSTGKGMAVAKEARAELRGYRVALEAKRVEIKAPALERCRQIDAEAKRITAELVALEEPIDATIKAEESRKEREKAEKAAAEADRLRVQTEWFDMVKALPLAAMNKSVAQIEELIAQAEALDPDAEPAVLPENKNAARFTRQMSVNTLKAARDARAADDARQAKIDADLAELAKRREADEAEARRREEVAAEQQRQAQAAADAREAQERRERAEAEARERAERDEQLRQEAEERAEAQRAIAAEQQRLTDERRKLEADQKAAAKAKRDAEIANATLAAAATEAVDLLRTLGQGEHLVTQKLAAALAREPKARKVA